MSFLFCCCRRRLSTKTTKSSKYLVLHGLNLDKRGYVEIEKFGTMTLAQYNDTIREWSVKTGFPVDTQQSNDERLIGGLLSRAGACGYAGVVFNPGGWLRRPDLKDQWSEWIQQAGVPVVEVHVTNPLKIGQGNSPIGVSCQGVVFGFGVKGYLMALAGLSGEL